MGQGAKPRNQGWTSLAHGLLSSKNAWVVISRQLLGRNLGRLPSTLGNKKVYKGCMQKGLAIVSIKSEGGFPVAQW